MKKSIKGNILLFLAAMIWGVSFVSQSVGVESLSPFAFNGIRMLLGALSVLPLLLVRGSCSLKNKKELCIGGTVCGLVLGAASGIQTYAMKYTTAGKCGFITALYILFVPLIGVLFGKRISKKVAFGIALSLLGMYFLCMYGGESAFNKGDALTLACAVCFAVHIMCVDFYSKRLDGAALSFVQFFVSGIANCFIMLVTGKVPAASEILRCSVPILYAGIMSCGVAYTLQIIGQKNTDTVVAAILMSFESVFSAIAGLIILKELMSVSEIVGCVLMFAAIIIVQLPDFRTRKNNA